MLKKHESSGPRSRAALALWTVLPLLGACAAPPLPTVERKTDQSEAAKPHSPVPAAPPEASPPPPATTVVVEAGTEGDGAEPTDLVSAAREAKERRAKGTRPSLVITNETLVKRPGPKSKTETPKAPAQAGPAERPSGFAREAEAERWKARALDVRTRIKDADDKVEKLSRLTAAMRERFYLSPPQLGRDDALWQEWGKLQENLALAEEESKSAREELETFLEEGRVAGADPGWLATGEELLIEKKKDETPPPLQAIEPPVVPPPGGRP